VGVGVSMENKVLSVSTPTHRALFNFKKNLVFDTVTHSFLFDKYYLKCYSVK
jgi:hypothetical protein